MVFLLKSHIENYFTCHGGSYKINILEEIAKYRRLKRRNPIIVIDFLSCLCLAQTGGKEVLSGGRHVVFIERVKHCMEELTKSGAELVFFADGPIKEPKLPLWTKSANEKYLFWQKIFEANKLSLEIDPTCISSSITLFYDSFLLATANYGKIYISLENECDCDMANYATRVNAFAVITPDTDFLIFPGDWRIWTTAKFDITSFSTVEWNKRNLRDKLFLRQECMPIFATLCGNDFMPKECVEHLRKIMNRGVFHNRLAELVRRLFPDGVPLSQESKNVLVRVICIMNKSKYTENEIRQFVDTSLAFYDCVDLPMGIIDPPWLKDLTSKMNSTIVYNIINNVSMILPQPYIDCNEPNVKQYCELSLPILCRQMGIVLYHEKENHSHVVYYKPNHTEPFEKRTVEMIKPDFNIPPFYDIVTNSRMETLKKFEILCWIISPNDSLLHPREVMDLDSHDRFFVSALKLYYLRKNGQISVDEADVLLLSIYESSAMSKEKRDNFEAPTIFNPRAFWIAMVFTQINYYFLNSLIISGLHDFVKPNSFDGYLFHKMYSKYFDKHSQEKNELLLPIKKYRLYKNIV